jgi:hypothetical protein
MRLAKLGLTGNNGASPAWYEMFFGEAKLNRLTAVLPVAGLVQPTCGIALGAGSNHTKVPTANLVRNRLSHRVALFRESHPTSSVGRQPFPQLRTRLHAAGTAGLCHSWTSGGLSLSLGIDPESAFARS